MNANFRDQRRLAPWWMCALMLVIAAFFGWVIYEGYPKPSTPGLLNRFLIPPYCVWIYLVLGALLNSQSIKASADGVTISTGPIPMGLMERIPRDRIAFCYFFSVLAISDDAGSSDQPFTIGHVAGIETVDGRQVVLVEPYRDMQAARDFAQAIAAALNQGGGQDPIEVRALQDPHTDPVGTGRGWLWGGIWGTAIASGLVWELVRHWPIL